MNTHVSHRAIIVFVYTICLSIMVFAKPSNKEAGRESREPAIQLSVCKDNLPVDEYFDCLEREWGKGRKGIAQHKIRRDWADATGCDYSANDRSLKSCISSYLHLFQISKAKDRDCGVSPTPTDWLNCMRINGNKERHVETPAGKNTPGKG